MIKKIFLLSLLLLSLVRCGNEQSDFPGSDGLGGNNSPPAEYKIFTPIFYRSPNSSEMFYHFIRLTDFNKINSSFFVFLDVASPKYKDYLSRFLGQRSSSDKINIVALGIIPKDIPLLEKVLPYTDKAVFLFPSQKPSLPSNKSSSSASSSNKVSIQTFPANYNYMLNSLKLRYSMQDLTFLATVLKALSGGNVNIPPLANVNEIAYIQGDGMPLSNIRVLQGESSDSMKEKTTLAVLDDGSIPGIPIDPTQTVKLTISYQKKESNYWIQDMKNSFPFFIFNFLPENRVDIASYFTPLKMSNLTFAGKHLVLPEDLKNKALYGLHIQVDPSVDGQATSWTGTYRNGELSLKISPNFVPIAYSSTNITMKLTGGDALKLFTEVGVTKKDYLSKSTSGSELTLKIASDTPPPTAS